jgi:hypothetical protein
MRQAAAVALLLPGAAMADGARWWQGAFAWDAAWCVNAERIGSVTPAPVAITAEEFLGYENSCRILRHEEWEAVGAVRLALECQSEGDMYDEDMMVIRAGADAVWIKWAGSEPERFHRCGAGQ